MRTLMTMLVATALMSAGCASEDIPQAYKGRMLGQRPLRPLPGKTGFYGPVLGPGTYFTGTYDESTGRLRRRTVVEPLTALTKDGVQFGLNIYVRFSADCSDAGVQTILGALRSTKGRA